MGRVRPEWLTGSVDAATIAPSTNWNGVRRMTDYELLRTDVSREDGYAEIEYERQYERGENGGGHVTVFDDGTIGVSFTNPNEDVLPAAVVEKMIALFHEYSEAGIERRMYDEQKKRIAELYADNERLWGLLVKSHKPRAALLRIADMPTEPRSDGSYNYCRNALIDIARRGLDKA